MKRSEINAIIRQSMEFLESMNFKLPPFAHWTPDEWRRKGPECRDIVEQQLGWDITDFGRGDYPKFGLFLFTIRNGSLQELASGGGKTYAEKVMIVREKQITPVHSHFFKMEDIINRGGGELVIQLWNDAGDHSLANTDVLVKMDGVAATVKAGDSVALKPGESITLEPGNFHTFWAAAGKGTVLIGEVSRVNDDNADNCFVEPIGRFPEIEEDEAPLRLLIPDYPNYYNP